MCVKICELEERKNWAHLRKSRRTEIVEGFKLCLTQFFPFITFPLILIPMLHNWHAYGLADGVAGKKSLLSCLHSKRFAK